MPKTPGKMRMNNMVKIDTIVFEIVGGGGRRFKAPPPDRYSCLKYPGSDRVNTDCIHILILKEDSTDRVQQFLCLYFSYTISHFQL